MWTTLRDFVLLGVGMGFCAPLPVVSLLAWGPVGPFATTAILVGSTVLGGLMGMVVGGVMAGLRRWLPEQGLWLSWVGFPLGSACGAAIGAVLWRVIDPPGNEMWTAFVLPPLVIGGLVLGALWMPYWAVVQHRRSGLPLVMAGILLSFILGVAYIGLALAGFNV